MRHLIKPTAAAGLALALGLVAGGASAQGRTFAAEGSDTVMGAGARHLAMGGTGAATANDPHAVYYNPSLLADIDRFTVSGTRQLDASLRPYTFIGAAVPLDFLEPLGFSATFGLARYNRVHAHTTGAWGPGDFESIFVRYLLPSLVGTYDGELDSKTLVNRFALGFSHDALPGLNLGVNVDWIDCKTNLCGVKASSSGITMASVHATALSYGVSASYHITPDLTVGAAFTDIDTQLDVSSIITDASGTRWIFSQAQLPRQFKAGVAWQASERLLVAGGYQKFWGTYGTYDLDFQTLHAGLEYSINDWLTGRAGAWMPIRLSASNGLALNFPALPVPTIGMGAAWGAFEADLAVYLHPLMSMSARRPQLSTDLTLTARF